MARWAVAADTGNAFDLVGERRQTSFKLDTNDHWADEHMYRWIRWEITSGSMDHKKTDALMIEFRPTIGRGSENTINYTDPLHLVKPRQALPQSAG